MWNIYFAPNGAQREWVKVKGPAAAIKEKEKTEEKLHDEKRKKTYNDIVLVCAQGEEWKKGRKKKRKERIFLVNILPPRGYQMALTQYVVAVLSLYVCCTLMMTNIRHDSRKKNLSVLNSLPARVLHIVDDIVQIITLQVEHASRNRSSLFLPK